MEDDFRHKVNYRLQYTVEEMSIKKKKKNGKPVIASNINVFRVIITNEVVSICVRHFTKVHRMLKKRNENRTKKKKKKKTL